MPPSPNAATAAAAADCMIVISSHNDSQPLLQEWPHLVTPNKNVSFCLHEEWEEQQRSLAAAAGADAQAAGPSATPGLQASCTSGLHGGHNRMYWNLKYHPAIRYTLLL